MILRRALGAAPESRASNPFGIPNVEDAQDVAIGSITASNAAKIGAVYASWTYLADATATLPVGCYRRQGRTRVGMPKPGWLISPIPNDPNTTRIDYFTQVVLSLAARGNAYTVAFPDVADPAEVRVLPPDRVKPERGPGGEVGYRITPPKGDPFVLFADQVVHIPWHRMPGELEGMDPISLAAANLGRIAAMESFSRKWFKNGIHLSGYLSTSSILQPKTKADVLRAWRSAYSGATNAGKAAILDGGLKWEPLSLTPEQAQFVESHLAGIEDVARMYRIAPYKLGVNRQGTMSYASVESNAIEFVVHTVRPLLERIEAAHARLLPFPDEFLKFTVDGLLRGDIASRYDAFSKGSTAGFLMADDIRATEDMPPLPEGGDRPRFPVNVADPALTNLKARVDALKQLTDAGVPLDRAERIVGLGGVTA